MFVLTKENITDYLKQHMPGLDYSKPLTISAIGEGTEEEDGDGYLNFIYRVSDDKCNLILKQGRSEGRVAGFTDLSPERNRLEYESMGLRKAIAPEYAFCGPAAFDIGYLESHLLSQFICAAFRDYEKEEERKEFQAYILATMQQLFEEYCTNFFAHWDADAKKIYQGVEGLQASVKKNLLAVMSV